MAALRKPQESALKRLTLSDPGLSLHCLLEQCKPWKWCYGWEDGRIFPSPGNIFISKRKIQNEFISVEANRGSHWQNIRTWYWVGGFGWKPVWSTRMAQKATIYDHKFKTSWNCNNYWQTPMPCLRLPRFLTKNKKWIDLSFSILLFFSNLVQSK